MNTYNIEWTNEDSRQAQKQGWDIYFADVRGHYEIERVDEMQLWGDDFEVIDFLTEQAIQGNKLAIKALAINWAEMVDLI